jgi:hypothetical protein
MSLNKQGPGKIDYCSATWNPIWGCVVVGLIAFAVWVIIKLLQHFKVI